MTDFAVNDWRAELDAAEASDWKEPIYRLMRPALGLLAQQALSRHCLEQLKPDLVLQQRGMPRIARKRWATGGAPLNGKTLLVKGCGTGWDVASWAKLSPKRIVAVDLFNFDSWGDIIEHCRRAHGVEVMFREAPLDELDFLGDQSVDLVASDAVYEHVRNLPEVMRETRRLLKPDGAVYASYGPLWYAAGGDHFSGRGGLEHVFNHVLLDPPEYRRYFEKEKLPKEDFQSGGRYVELDLFSKLRTKDYLDTFRSTGFSVERLMLQVCRNAQRFAQQFPSRFSDLVVRHEGVSSDDFLLDGNIVRLRPAR